MKIYFLSSQPCALYFNGAYFGNTNLFERFAEISLNDNLFVEFTPQNALPIRFFLTEEIRFSPPKGCEVYLLPHAIAIYARDFPPNDYSLRLICQKRLDNLLVSVFQQGEIQISFQTPENYFVATLPPSFLNCEIDFHGDLCFVFHQTQLSIFTKTGKCLFLEEILDYSVVENTLNATLPLSNALARQAKCTYTLSSDSVTQTAFSLQIDIEKEQRKEEIVNSLLSYLFFESVLLGADTAPYLAEELQADKDKFKGYLGDFKQVVFSNIPNVCALIYPKAENLFQADYFETEIQNGKITNVKRHENG